MSTKWLGMVFVILAASDARAQEAATCVGAEEPPPEQTVCSAQPQSQSLRWADLGLGLAAVALGLSGAGYVHANEKRRRAAFAPPTRVDAAPFAAGAALGVAFAVSLLVFGRPVGASGGVLRASEGLLTWQVWILVGLVAGGAGGALLAGTLRLSVVPTSWAVVHGPSVVRRFVVVFFAAALMEVAAAIAGGCTSGLALSGGVALAPGAFVFMAAMFVTGMPAARLVHGRRHR